MKKNSKLSRHQQDLAVEWMHLVSDLARYFVKNRSEWQRSLYSEDLEGEGFLALSKAVRTYDPKRLPFPKAYFVRAILNAMFKYIKKATGEPGLRVQIKDIDELPSCLDELDHIRTAIELLDLCDQPFATDRFSEGETLKFLSVKYGIPIRIASIRSSRLARQLAELLEIQQTPPRIACVCLSLRTIPESPSPPGAS